MVNGDASVGRAAGNDMAELVLLLPLSQAHALEQAAERLGLSTGQLLRRLVHGFLMQQKAPSNHVQIG